MLFRSKLRTAFKTRFEIVSAEIAAKHTLHDLFQKGMDVPSYTARFNEHADRTGYSKEDLRDRYYENLSESIKDAIAASDRKTKTLEELVDTATTIDQHLRERQEERRGHRVEAHSSSAPAAPSIDPNAMQVDALRPGSTRTRFDFRKEMRGRCYSCGSKDHVKTEGHHDRDLCSYCLRTGHQVQVCQDKFLGVEPKMGLKKGKAPAHQVRAGTIEEVAEESSGSPPSAPKSGGDPSIEQMAAMMDQMKAELAALKQSAF